ncbi:tripartite motif containing 35-30 [Myxocyprinus asiaticus]|uniref:tripartite motif containing 35-30 n=1 Tax=Myxocyprinus asiaticus TaxID=70543 RepID=UPI0022224B30|nr:tripartite motif containing 35-30 [Myxocyprinus asiaticus]XP_051580643.1 tripartite motif containing 35-30 [Myxocyprinus asiaticus]
MACRQSLSEKDFSCPICCDIFKDPVLLACSHSICKGCVQTFWNRRGTRNCPICRTVSSNPDPPINIVLRDICVLLREETSPDVPEETAGSCGLHGDPLTFFCMEDKQPVCEKCRNTKLHKNHCIRSTKDASQDLRQLLHVKLRAFEEKLGVYNRFKQFCDETVEYIKMQSQHTETQIKEAFEKLHQFLENEKAARITALRREEEQKSEIIKKKMEEIRSGILSLSRIIESIEEQLVRNDFTFLVNYKAAVERTQCTLQDHVRPSGVLIDVAKHVGNMTFNVSKKLQAIVRYTPVTLDPNTAHPYLVVSDDLTSIVYTDELFQQLPANPERFDGYTSVLGSQGFSSGTHSWDIEVGDSTAWAVGVVTESAFKNRENPSKTGLWYVGFCNGKYGKGCSPEILTLLRVSQKIQRISVQLDWDKGKVIFTESAHNIALHVFKHTFTERVFPYFYNHCKLHPLRIIPVKTIVNTQI